MKFKSLLLAAVLLVPSAALAGNYASPTYNVLTLSTPLAVPSGGTGGASALAARQGIGAAASGANSDITSLTGLTTPLSAAQGGSGVANSYNFTLGVPFTTTGFGSLTINTSGPTTLNVPSGTNTMAGMAFQAPGSVAITGGTIDGATLGATTPGVGNFSSITAHVASTTAQ